MSDENKQHPGEPVACQVEFIQGETPRVISWNDHPAGVYRLYTHADPGEVKERIRKETESYAAEVERLRAQLVEWKERCQSNSDEAMGWIAKHDTLRAQLAERDALLREVLVGLWPSTPMAIKINAALSASAEPVEPLYPKCTVLKDVNVRYSNSTAPVERDERAEFEAWFTDHSKDWPFASESIKCIARDNDWLVWQARAALARK